MKEGIKAMNTILMLNELQDKIYGGCLYTYNKEEKLYHHKFKNIKITKEKLFEMLLNKIN